MSAPVHCPPHLFTNSAIRSPFGSDVAVHEQQKLIHLVSEAVGLFVTVPFFFYASTRLPTEAERNAAFWMGVGALVVDGFLFLRYITGTTGKAIL